MTTTNISDMNDSQIDRLLGMVDEAPAPQQPQDELTAQEKELVRTTLSKAFYTARAEGKSVEEAKAIGNEAVRALFAARSAASVPATAAPASTGTRSAPTQPATNGSAPSSSREYDPDEQCKQHGCSRWRCDADHPIDGEADKVNHETHAASQKQGVDVHGLARSERDVEALRSAGFSPRDTVYTRGLRVIQAGVDAAKESRLEYERKPLVVDMCRDLEGKIAAERRHDMKVTAQTVRMQADTGMFDFVSANGALCALEPTREAFGAMCGRLGYGGAQYLADKCPAPLRAHNVNAQHALIKGAEDVAWNAWNATGRKGKEPEPKELVLRTRLNDRTQRREIFSVVTPGYAPFDADKVAEAIREATPAGARGTVTYDGRKTRFEVLFQSTVQPKHYVAGEVFRAGSIVTTDDTGGGSIRGSSVAWQNLCLNLAIIDEMALDAFALRHTGSVLELARKFKHEFAKCLARIGHFVKAWDYACEDDVVVMAHAISTDKLPTDKAEQMAGIFRGLLSGGAKARIRLPSVAKVEEHVDALVRCWMADDSSATRVYPTSRAAVVNAFTRYAHTIEVDDPFADDEIQRQASALLWGKGGKLKPMEYVALELTEEQADKLATVQS